MPQPNHALAYRPLCGGIVILNPIVAEEGTLGCVATSDGADRWLISCYHVLCRSDMSGFADGEPIFQPAGQRVAQLSLGRADSQLDCAAALVDPGIDAIGEVLGIGSVAGPIPAAIGMRVVKSGLTTGVTEGIVNRILGDGTIEIGPSAPGAVVSQRGDSGALWLNLATAAAVALHTGETPFGLASAIPIDAVLRTLNLRLI